MHARGSVSHAVIEIREGRPTLLVDASTAAQPAKVIWETWFDRKSGLARVRSTAAGVEQFDVAGRTQCIPAGTNGVTKRLCLPPGPPFELQNRGFTWPASATVREIGKGSFRGRDVVWLAQLTNGKLQPGADRVALDARTHHPVDFRRLANGRVMYEQIYSSLDVVPARDVDFVVPKAKKVTHSWPPFPTAGITSAGRGLGAASSAFGRSPLWLGPSFRGRTLRAAESESIGPAPGVSSTSKMVTFDYAGLTLREFRAGEAPFTADPPPGKILIDPAQGASLVRDGVLVTFAPVARPRLAVAIAKALRPVPRK